VRERWRTLNRETRIVLVLAGAFVLFRTGVASLSGFGFHQGWNEGHYALIADGFLDHPLVPQYAERYVYSVPPLFPYSVSASFLAFGESVLAARVPSILAGGGLLVATYALGSVVLDEARTALVGAVLLASLPYVQLYAGRVQTDALMVCLVTASLAAIVRGYERETGHRRWLLLGGGLFAAAFAAKQPALLLPAIVLLWLVGNRRFDADTLRRTGVLIAASAAFLVPVAAWLSINYLLNPTAFVTDWQHELFGRTAPFANVPLLLAIGLGLGTTPFVLLGAAVGAFEDVAESVRRVATGERAGIGPSPLTWWLLLYGAFVFVRTPHGHQYYALVLTPPLALFAARGIEIATTELGEYVPNRRQTVHLALTALVVASALGGTVVLFELSGEFSASEGGGTQVAADAGAFVTDEVPDDATILAPNGYGPPIMWYVRDEFPTENVDAYHPATLSEERLRTAMETSDGPVYLVYPTPSWGTLPSVEMTEVHRTDEYEYTVMSLVGEYVRTDSKFGFYLEDRGLVTYRLDSSLLKVGPDSRPLSPVVPHGAPRRVPSQACPILSRCPAGEPAGRPVGAIGT
jgi:4-amino-4-deoxy-L-arabinose transferase-like glycosyltransferase